MSRIAWATAGILGIGLIAVSVDNRRLRSTLAEQAAQAASAGPVVASLGLHGDVEGSAGAGGAGSGHSAEDRPRSDGEVAAAGRTTAPMPVGGLQDLDGAIEARVAERLEEAVESRMADKRSEWFDGMRDRTTDKVDDFADEAGLSDADREAMHGIIDDTMEDLIAIWHAHEGEDDREAAHEAMRAETVEIRNEMDEALVALLGEDDAEAFQQGLRGPLSWH